MIKKTDKNELSSLDYYLHTVLIDKGYLDHQCYLNKLSALPPMAKWGSFFILKFLLLLLLILWKLDPNFGQQNFLT